MAASSDDTWSLTVGHPSCIVNFSHGLRGTPQAWCYMRVRVVSFLLCFFAWCARREFKVAYTRCFFGEPSRERHRRNQGGFVGGCVSASWNSKCPPPFLSSTLASYFFFIFVASFFFALFILLYRLFTDDPQLRAEHLLSSFLKFQSYLDRWRHTHAHTL